MSVGQFVILLLIWLHNACYALENLESNFQKYHPARTFEKPFVTSNQKKLPNNIQNASQFVEQRKPILMGK